MGADGLYDVRRHFEHPPGGLRAGIGVDQRGKIPLVIIIHYIPLFAQGQLFFFAEALGAVVEDGGGPGTVVIRAVPGGHLGGHALRLPVVRLRYQMHRQAQEQRQAQLRTKAASGWDSVGNLLVLTLLQGLMVLGFLLSEQGDGLMSILEGFGGIALCHTGGKLHFLLGGQQRNATDLLQIHPHRIVNGKTVHRNGLVDLILGDFFHVVEVFLVEILLQRVLLHGDLHAHLFQRNVELVLLVSVQLQGVDGLVDLLHGDPTVFLAELQQIVQHLLLVHRFVFLFCHVASSFIPACAVWPPKGVPDHPPARFVSDNDIGSYRSGHAIPLFAAGCPPAGPK